MGIELPKDFVLSNAAGFVKTAEQARDVLRSAATRCLLGTLMPEYRKGNIGTTYYFDEATQTSYNSMGIPSQSPDQVMSWLPALYKDAAFAGKQLGVSIGGEKPEDYGTLAKLYAPHVDYLEVNWGCGNLWGPAGQKPVPSYHPKLALAIAKEVRKAVGSSVRVGFKISPLEMEHGDTLLEIMTILAEYADEVTGVNTKINQHPKKSDGTDALAWQASEGAEMKHTGGMGGKLLTKDAIRILHALLQLPEKISVLSCGGIFTGADAAERIRFGADGVALYTALGEYGLGVFGEIGAAFV